MRVTPLAQGGERKMVSIWSTARRSAKSSRASNDHRVPFEHDYDRLLFSPPVRRLADKTQVFPLDRNDAVRTRLTHSHEVANLAKSMGTRLLSEGIEFAGMPEARAVQSILATIGLAHDLGNPPFGHQGEAAIGHWFKNQHGIFDPSSTPDDLSVPERLWPEFLEFEGNAQTFRILTRLQVAIGGFGLDLTAGTLAALLKYPTPCDKRAKGKASTKKYGFFESEIDTVRWVRAETGLEEGERHSLTWIMEAADDIAYSVLDIEDAIRKGIISPDDVCALINHDLDGDYSDTKEFLRDKFKETREGEFSISATREIMSSYLRTAFIQKLIDETIDDFKSDKKSIDNKSRQQPLIHNSALLSSLKRIAKEYVFIVQDVRKIEADGFKIIDKLMDFYWHAITQRKSVENLLSRRTDAKAAYGISKMSDNYLQCAAKGKWSSRDGSTLPMRYRELRLLTDMVAGMTDGFAKSEYDYLLENDFISHG